MILGVGRAEPPNSPGPMVMIVSAEGKTSGGIAGDSEGEGGRGIDAGSGRWDGSHSGSVWRADIRTAGADQIGIKSGTQSTLHDTPTKIETPPNTKEQGRTGNGS